MVNFLSLRLELARSNLTENIQLTSPLERLNP
jgi:hypothetical protein